MAVCGRPSVATSYMLVGLFRRICTVLWKLAGREGRSPPFTFSPSSFMVSVKGFFCGAFRKLASAPSPFPSTPWHCAPARSTTLRPPSPRGGDQGPPLLAGHDRRRLQRYLPQRPDARRYTHGGLAGHQDEHPHYQENGGRKSVHAVPFTGSPPARDFA